MNVAAIIPPEGDRPHAVLVVVEPLARRIARIELLPDQDMLLLFEEGEAEATLLPDTLTAAMVAALTAAPHVLVAHVSPDNQPLPPGYLVDVIVASAA